MDMVSASCTVNKGDLPVEIHWKRNGHKIFSNDGISISRTNKRMSVLSIESVRDRHSGEYTCVAENSAGVVEHTAMLSVNGTYKFRCFQFVRRSSSFSSTLFNVLAIRCIQYFTFDQNVTLQIFCKSHSGYSTVRFWGSN